MKCLLGCGSDTGIHGTDAEVADVAKDKAGTTGAGGLAGTGNGSDVAVSSGGGGGHDAAGLSTGGSGGAVDGGGSAGAGGVCASFRLCDLDDQMLAYGPGSDEPSRCPVEHECYYLPSVCGPTACVLRAGSHCDDPLACDPGDSRTADDDPACFAANLCYQKSLCGKYLLCRRSVDGGASLDVAVDSGASTEVALDVAASVDVAVDLATPLDTLIDGAAALVDGAACNPEDEYQRRYVASSPSTCAMILYSCPDTTISFQNDWGCGGEQSSSCPPFVNCMPGSGDTDPLCDTSSADCPYTVRAE